MAAVGMVILLGIGAVALFFAAFILWIIIRVIWDGWPAILGLTLGILVSNSGSVFLGVVLIIGGIVGTFRWNDWLRSKNKWILWW